MQNDKTLINSLYNFLEDTEGLTEKDIVSALKDRGIDVSNLKIWVTEHTNNYKKHGCPKCG